MAEHYTEQFFPSPGSVCPHSALELGYSRFDEETSEPSIDGQGIRSEIAVQSCLGKNLPISLSEICPQRRQDFAAQFSDLSHEVYADRAGCPVSVTWEAASRLFQSQFGLSPSTALKIWQQVASDDDLGLDENEYCLAAHLAEKITATECQNMDGSYSTNSCSSTSRNSEEEYLESVVPDESLDYLLSPESAGTTFFRNLSDTSSHETKAILKFQLGIDPFSSPSSRLAPDDVDDPEPASSVSELSFSKLAERNSSTDLYRSHRGNTRSLPACIYGRSKKVEPPDQRSHNYLQTSSIDNQMPSIKHAHDSINDIDRISVDSSQKMFTFPHNINRVYNSNHKMEDDDDHSSCISHSNDEDDANDVATLLPFPSTHRAIMAKVNEALLIRSKHSNTSSSSSSRSSSSSSSNFSQSADDEYGSVNYLSCTSSQISRRNTGSSLDESSPATDSSPVDPIEVLSSITGVDRNGIRQLSRKRRRKMLFALLRQAKSSNYILLRLNNELSGELKELHDQFINLNIQVNHLSINNHENIGDDISKASKFPNSFS